MRVTTRRTRTAATVITVGVLAAVNVIASNGPRHAMLVLGPAASAALLLLARSAGLTLDDLGLDPRRVRRGAAYAGVGAAIVVVVYAVAAALPGVRLAFADERHRQSLGEALVAALIVIPLATVLLEEVAFRGVLWGLIRRDHGTAWATAVSSVLFGLWHVLPSLRLGQANRAVGGTFGHGPAAQVLWVTGAVLFTALAGVVLCELRRRSGSLVAPFGLHWATNGLGVLASAAVWGFTS
jgi:membrane protease YdiL (CAAX protease family)